MKRTGLQVWEGLEAIDHAEQQVKAGTWVQPVCIVETAAQPKVVVKTSTDYDKLLGNLKGLKV